MVPLQIAQVMIIRIQQISAEIMPLNRNDLDNSRREEHRLPVRRGVIDRPETVTARRDFIFLDSAVHDPAAGNSRCIRRGQTAHGLLVRDIVKRDRPRLRAGVFAERDILPLARIIVKALPLVSLGLNAIYMIRFIVGGLVYTLLLLHVVFGRVRRETGCRVRTAGVNHLHDPCLHIGVVQHITQSATVRSGRGIGAALFHDHLLRGQIGIIAVGLLRGHRAGGGRLDDDRLCSVGPFFARGGVIDRMIEEVQNGQEFIHPAPAGGGKAVGDLAV